MTTVTKYSDFEINEDGKLVPREDEEVDFEENLTFDG